MVGATPAFAAEKVFRVAMTAADIPLTTGQASQGSEGVRFMGVTAYDALCNWELSHSDRPVGLRPGLATSWSVDPARTTRWIFKLREGVTFHDGSAFDSSSVVWNLDKLILSTSPQYDTAQVAQAATWTGVLASYRAVDKYTVELITKQPDANLPYEMANIFMSSPARWQEMGKDWTKVGLHPSGTGPWAVDKVVPRERVEFVRNAAYWDKARIPKCDRMIILPMPDAVTRVSALLNGQIDWVEAPPPDTIGQLKQAGMQIVLNTYPHIWPYLYSTLPDSPFKDVRVRHAMNFAVDREGLCTLLGGTAIPAKGLVPPGHPWFGKPTFDIKYDLPQARALMAQAGYSKANPLKAKIIIAQGGTGQMLSLPMNEFIQQSLAEIDIQVEFEVVELETLYLHWRSGAKADMNAGKGISAINLAYVTADPFLGLVRFEYSKYVAPNGVNWGGYANPKVDEAIDKIRTTFVAKDQDALLGFIHQQMVDDALMLWVVHDTNPHALSPKVKQFVQAQHWFQDLTTIGL
jgi:peptide/nickel transport system substrate-binding protein